MTTQCPTTPVEAFVSRGSDGPRGLDEVQPRDNSSADRGSIRLRASARGRRVSNWWIDDATITQTRDTPRGEVATVDRPARQAQDEAIADSGL